MLDDVKERILRSDEDRAKLRQEVKQEAKELGIEKLVSIKNKDEFEVLDDLKNNATAFSEQMQKAEEKQKQEQTARRKRHMESVTRPMSEAEFFRRKEAKEKAAYEARKISL